MDLPVFAQDEALLPFEEVEAVLPCLGDQLTELSRWQIADARLGVDANPEQHLVLDDVADAGEDLLVEQGIADPRVGLGLERAPGQLRIPVRIEHVDAPVVAVLERPFDVLERRRVDIEFTVVEAQRGAGGRRFALVDPVRAEHQHVHAQAEAAKLDQEVLAPAPQRDDAASLHAGEIERAVARGVAHGLAAELGRLLTQDHDRRAFGHGSSAAGAESG